MMRAGLVGLGVGFGVGSLLGFVAGLLLWAALL